jgi:hypothetical protein
VVAGLDARSRSRSFGNHGLDNQTVRLGERHAQYVAQLVLGTIPTVRTPRRHVSGRRYLDSHDSLVVENCVRQALIALTIIGRGPYIARHASSGKSTRIHCKHYAMDGRQHDGGAK